MKTTVIIPNYNGKEYLKECLLSLQECDETSFHTIVVDNGSTDGSVALLKEEFPQVELIALSENTGFAAAVNRGLEHTKTPYAILLNNDTRIQPGFVLHLEQALEKQPKVFSVSAKMVMMHSPDLLDGAGDLYCALGWAYALGKGKQEKEKYRESARVFSACGGAVIYKMDVLKQIGFFDENHFAYLEDVDIGYRAAVYGFRNYYEPSAVCLHAGSASSGSRYNEFKVALASRNSIYLIFKNMPFLQILCNLPFLLLGYLTKIVFFAIKGYGHTYCKGLLNGFRLSFSKEGRKHKVCFKWKHFSHYLYIEAQLLYNMLRLLE